MKIDYKEMSDIAILKLVELAHDREKYIDVLERKVEYIKIQMNVLKNMFNPDENMEWAIEYIDEIKEEMDKISE